jgi:putative colanic acid biosynthesis UDP-glucose lipid carrier transferase
MKKKVVKYSKFIRPLIILLDIIIINAVVFYFSDKEYINSLFISYINFSWLLIAYYTKFYNVYRYTHILKVFSFLASQFFVFLLAFFAYFSIFREGVIISKQFVIIITFTVIITFFKLFSFFLLKRYRAIGRNFRSVIVFGGSKSAQSVVKLFSKRQDLGYRFYGFFSDKEGASKKCLGSIKQGLEFSKENNIEEIYCEINATTQVQLEKIRNFCNTNKIDFNLIPENKAIYSKNFTLEYYGMIPILKRKQLPFEKVETHVAKRIFDIFFSLTVCVFLLSWLMPILWVLVRLTSKGPFFFKQIRDGINGEQFYCYKIRSMEVNALSDQIGTTKDDSRITKMGAFLRKTSLDEFPQFFNVLKGDMSVIGPRPHMNIETEKYLKEIDNYLIRNSVKPGITGLAQVSGYRGEVQKKSDIEHRVRFDIFYIENWSFFLDIKIIFQTFLNVFKGQEKAY